MMTKMLKSLPPGYRRTSTRSPQNRQNKQHFVHYEHPHTCQHRAKGTASGRFTEAAL